MEKITRRAALAAIPAAQARLAGIGPAASILLASIVGMAICTVWIAITWRAWS